MTFARPQHLTIAAALLVAACGDTTGIGTPTNSSVRLNLATGISAGAAASGAALSPVTLADSTHTLVIDSASLVLRRIELRRATAVACAASDGTAADSSAADSAFDDHGGRDGRSGHDDDCAELEAGPLLLDLPLGTDGAITRLSVPADTGLYSRVEFRIRAADGSRDAAFAAAHPEMAGRSIRVTGSFDGRPFTWTSALDAEMEIDLVPPLAVAAGGTADLTLQVSVDGWFRDAAGALIDPATALAGGPMASVVTANVARTFHAFEDGDRNGRDDHGGHGADDPAGDDHGGRNGGHGADD